MSVGSARAAAVLALLACGAALAPRADGDEAASYASILEQKAPAIVTVKFVMKIRTPGGEREQNAETRGVVVASSGLVMLSSTALEPSRLFRLGPGAGPSGGPGSDPGFVPSDFKVLLGSEATEHEAVLVARESTLGLAFVQLLSPPAGALAPVDFAQGAEPRVGQVLAGVTRKGRGFDAAAVLERAFVSGRLEKPRPLWALAGSVTLGLPLYDLQGKVVGAVVHQRGVEGTDEPGSRGLASLLAGSEAFLLPVDAVARALEMVKKRVPEAVEKAKASRDATKPADAAAPTTPGPGADDPAPRPAPPDDRKPPPAPPPERPR